MSETRFPRGHAFIHFRSANGTVKIDFPRVDEPFVDDMRGRVIAAHLARVTGDNPPSFTYRDPVATPSDTEPDEPVVQEVKRG